MKLRNRLLALFCILLFAGFGVLYFRTWVVRKPFAVILFVGDGLVGSKLAAARLFDGGASSRLALEAFPNLALLSNHSSDFAVPDAGAAASMIATGKKVPNRSLSISPSGERLPTLLDLAAQRGRASGLVTNGSLGDAGPAAFYAHLQGNPSQEKITAQLAENPNATLLLGGGSVQFLPESKEGARKDGRDLLLEFRDKGYTILRTPADLNAVQPWAFPKVLGLFGSGNLPSDNSVENGAGKLSLADMVANAIRILQANRNGYLLIVDASLIQHNAIANRGEQTLVETVALDRAIETAVRYAGDNALILAVAKMSTGGMTMNGYPLRKDSGAALLGPNPAGLPSITWATGPNNSGGPEEPAAEISREPAAHYSPGAVNVVEDSIAIGKGPGSEALRGFKDNTVLFDILSDKL